MRGSPDIPVVNHKPVCSAHLYAGQEYLAEELFHRCGQYVRVGDKVLAVCDMLSSSSAASAVNVPANAKL